MKKKLANKPEAYREEFAQKQKLVSLIKEQLHANKRNFESNEIVAQKKDPNAGVLSNKICSFYNLHKTIVLIGDKKETRDLTSVEKEALEQFQRKDQQIDDMLVTVIQDMDLLKEKAIHIDAVFS